MLKSKKVKITLVLIFFAAAGIIGWNVYQFHSVQKVCYRPMIFHNNTLFWDEKTVEYDTEDFEYIGTVTSCVPNGEKPDSNFECNSISFMNAELYRSENSTFYALCTNGNLLLLEGSSQINCDATEVVAFNE